MNRLAVAAAIATMFVLSACGGGDNPSQTVAKQWITAAVHNNLGMVRKLTADDYDEQAMDYVKFIQEEEFSLEHMAWAAGGESGGVYEWSAANGPNIVTMKLRSDGAGSWLVQEVAISW